MKESTRYSLQALAALTGSISTFGAAYGLYYESWRFAAIGVLIALTIVLFIGALINIALADKP